MTEMPATETSAVNPFAGLEEWRTNDTFYQRALKVATEKGAVEAHVCFMLLVERELDRQGSRSPRQAMANVLEGLERYAKYHGSEADRQTAVQIYRTGTKLPVFGSNQPRPTSALPCEVGHVVVEFMTREDLAAKGARERAARRAARHATPSDAPTPPAG